MGSKNIEMMANKTNFYDFNVIESSGMKGFLMLLIMLGHNHILAPIGGQLFNYLYSFHIYGFFILPFLYSRQLKIDKKTILDGFIRLWIPYIFFFLVCYFIYHLFVIKDKINFGEIIYGIINAEKSTLKNITGFTFLWFLPAYYSMSVVMMILNKKNISTYLVVLLLIVSLNYNLFFTINNIFPKIPFAIIQGFYYFTFGFLTKLLLDKFPRIQYIAAIVFIVFSIIFWINSIPKIPYVLPIFGFLFIFSMRKLFTKITLIVLIGKYSLPIYLIHVIVYNAFEVLLPNEMLFGILNFLITMVTSMLIAYLAVEIKFIQKLIFPKNWNDFKSTFVNE